MTPSSNPFAKPLHRLPAVIMTYPSGTKVICIDATPIPIRCGPGITVLDFTFPNGFLQEGTTYCAERAHPLPDGSFGLYLTGLPILIHGQVANWHSSRFEILQPQGQKIKTQHATLKSSHVTPTQNPSQSEKIRVGNL